MADIAVHEEDRTTDTLSKARAIVLVLLGAELMLLVVSGIALFFVYRPSSGAAGHDLGLAGLSQVRLADIVRGTHRVAGQLAVPTAVAAGVLVAMRGRSRVDRPAGLLFGIGIVMTTLMVSFTGFRLPWDQLALSAVRVGTDFSGYRFLFGDEVRFVLIGKSAVSKEAMARSLAVHMLVLGPLLLALVGAAWWRYAKLRTPRPNPPIVPSQY